MLKYLAVGLTLLGSAAIADDEVLKAEAKAKGIHSAAILATFPNPEADHIIQYGPEKLQYGELRLPEGDGPFPLVMNIHGGCWLSMFDIAHSRWLADDLRQRGYATWNVEYRRIGDEGGGWPGTFEDIAAAWGHVAKMADEMNIDADRVAVMGHSAGGHLALWMAGRPDEFRQKGSLEPRGVVALAPAADLRFLDKRGSCGKAATRLMGGSPTEVPDRYALGDGISRMSMDVPQVVVTGKYDVDWTPPAMRYVEAARKAGAPVTLQEAPDSGHFEMIMPSSSTWSLVLKAVEDVLGDNTVE